MGVLQHMKEHSITPAYDLIFMMSTYEEVGHGMSHIPECISELIAVDMGCIGLDLAAVNRMFPSVPRIPADRMIMK